MKIQNMTRVSGSRVGEKMMIDGMVAHGDDAHPSAT